MSGGELARVSGFLVALAVWGYIASAMKALAHRHEYFSHDNDGSKLLLVGAFCVAAFFVIWAANFKRLRWVLAGLTLWAIYLWR
jgi:hypothetical protein